MIEKALEPKQAIDALAGSTKPFIVGVRHHSPACAAAVPALLDAFAPERLLIELPQELGSWLGWLGDPELAAPVALAAAGKDSGELFFYPFADFSPELAAVRWAAKHKVTIEAFDLPAGARDGSSRMRKEIEGPSLVDLLHRQHGSDDVESLWDRMIEVRANRDDPEATRRAALMFGWALRFDEARAGGPAPVDLRREAYMRTRLAESKAKTAVVIGSFHAGALLETPIPVPVPPIELGALKEVVTSMVPYAFELLDSRSGYPAGIRDPRFQQRAFEILRDGGESEQTVAELVAQIARAVRARGHVAGIPDAAEAARLARDVATLRGLPAPGRRELLEAIETSMGQGERLGRGRILAKALEEVLVGRARGTLPKAAPRSGLVPHVVDLTKELSLPGPPGEKESKQMDLDPLRSNLDRKRQIVIERLRAAGVVYANEEARTGVGGSDTLTTRWEVRWTPATEATIEVAGLLGVTLQQAAEGALRRSEKLARQEDKWGVRGLLVGVRAAAACALPELARERLIALAGEGLKEAGLAEVIEALALIERITRGHVPGLPVEEFSWPAEVRPEDFIAAAVRAVEGLTGSTRIEDAVALGEVVDLAIRERAEGQSGIMLGEGRLGFSLDQLAREGSPLMQGAGGAARVLLGRDEGRAFADRVGSFIDAAVDREGKRDLVERLKGALVLASPLFEAHPGFVDALLDRIEALDDRSFLDRVAAIRGGFEVLSPAARQRLLDAIGARAGEDAHGMEHAMSLALSPEQAGHAASADRAGKLVVEALGLPIEQPPPMGEGSPPPKRIARPGDTLGLLDRARLILGRERERLPPQAARYASALDELYGHGKGEGRKELGIGVGGGKEAPFPTVREWSDELEELFGTEVREEVLGRAAAGGRTAAALALDPDAVTPSVELLEQVLSLKGGLAEKDMGRLRKLVSRIVDQLVQALARRVRPALAGIVMPRPTRRSVGPLDLRRTLSQNLKTARRNPDGSIAIVAEDLIFKTRARRSLDWHLVLVVDVSGSMDASVIHSAIMAAIIDALPAVSVKFVAFNTQVMDLSERVDDPLGLLLEISVGGGTEIEKGLRYARGQLKVPQRSMVVVISDFEQGGSVPELVAEVRALVESGARVLGLAALDDRGAPRYHRAIAEMLVEAGMPIAALTPLELARWVAEQIR
ncbi:MAG: DUF5682 family protein [Polyangiales bacterium]